MAGATLRGDSVGETDSGPFGTVPQPASAFTWRWPKRLWHTIANEDKEADLRNTARLPGNASAGAGSRNAAHFLLEFANAPLCHFDIFASTWNWSGEAPGAGFGATGAPLRTLLSAFESRS